MSRAMCRTPADVYQPSHMYKHLLAMTNRTPLAQFQFPSPTPMYAMLQVAFVSRSVPRRERNMVWCRFIVLLSSCIR
jgi:hypothetical protein